VEVKGWESLAAHEAEESNERTGEQRRSELVRDDRRDLDLLSFGYHKRPDPEDSLYRQRSVPLAETGRVDDDGVDRRERNGEGVRLSSLGYRLDEHVVCESGRDDREMKIGGRRKGSRSRKEIERYQLELKETKGTKRSEEKETVKLTVLPSASTPTATHLSPLRSQERLVIPPTPRHRLGDPAEQELPRFLQ